MWLLLSALYVLIINRKVVIGEGAQCFIPETYIKFNDITHHRPPYPGDPYKMGHGDTAVLGSIPRWRAHSNRIVLVGVGRPTVASKLRRTDYNLNIYLFIYKARAARGAFIYYFPG